MTDPTPTPQQPLNPGEPQTPSQTAPAPAAPTADSRRDTHHDDPLRHSRTSGAWAAVIASALLLLLLVIFIIQNTESVDIEFLGFEGSVPLAAALLIATIIGMAVVGAVGSLRILQLRRRIKKDRR